VMSSSPMVRKFVRVALFGAGCHGKDNYFGNQNTVVGGIDADRDDSWLERTCICSCN